MLPLRNLGRVRQVLTVVTRHGLGYLTDRILSEPVFRFLRPRKIQVPSEIVAAERLVSALEALGPTYVKLGQFLSLRPDILPPAFINAFSKLYDKVKPVPFTEIKEVVQEEFGKSV
ncbi:MAG: hypothetical protein COX46_02925, partial [bacterium (Candidatus Ratteibacteria) CG23_combo_of_CG06-09_8_20_14_all_48_7]